MLKILLIVLAIIVLVLAGPLLVIWMLNTLFGLGLTYTAETWLAALLLGMLVGESKASK